MYQSKLTEAMISDEQYNDRLMLLWTTQWNYGKSSLIKQLKDNGMTFKEYIDLMKKTYKDPEYFYVRQCRNCYYD